MTTTTRTTSTRAVLLNKVPEVTFWFWIIKVLCTTVGESAADFLNVNLGLGLTGTTVVTGALLVVALALQFGATRYLPSVYWTTVALVSVFGTLVTDNLTEGLGVPLETSAIVFGSLLGATFIAWYYVENTLSIHSIFTRRREAFYWLAVLFTFALGTATGDLMAEKLGLGYLVTGVIVAALIATTALAWKLGLNSVLCFWIIYILTRPLGASLGDYLSQPADYGGLGLGATVTSGLFIVGIIAIVIYLSVTKADTIANTVAARRPERVEKGGLLQTAIVVVALVVVGGTAYQLRTATLDAEAAETTTASVADGSGVGSSPLGDMSSFRTISQDTLDLLDAGKQTGATNRIADLEREWDKAQATLQRKDKAAWTELDDQIDATLRALRSTSPDVADEKAQLAALLALLP